MNKGYFHSSGTLPIVMYPDRFHMQRFIFTVEDEDWDITSFTWQLVIKKNKGNNVNLLSLTLGSGLSFPIYEVNVIDARFETSQLSALGEGKYFWMLIKTDTNEPIIKGECVLSFDPEDGGDSEDVTVNVANNIIEVQVQALLTGNSSGGGGGGGSDFYRGDFNLTAGTYPAAGTGSGTGGAIQEGDQWRITLDDPTSSVTIGGRQYLHGQLLEAAIDGPGQTTANWIRIIT